jgi:histidinol-phosphate/aromatic aminotransferase/cobyric acid decarboxylase-like protein
VPSHTNFVYVLAGPERPELVRQLADRGVLISRTAQPAWVRVSVGRPEEIVRFADILAGVLNA